jgi:hypothetical protein
MTVFPLLVAVGVAAGCAAHATHRIEKTLEHVAIRDEPDPDRAYLIIDANVVPADQPQPTWIHIWRGLTGIHLKPGQAMYALHTGRAVVTHLDFQDSPASGLGTIFIQAPIMELRPGTIYFYGTIQIDVSEQPRSVRTLWDPSLYLLACQQAPQVFRQFDLETIYRRPENEVPLPPCRERRN